MRKSITMTTTTTHLLTDVLELMNQLAGDWEYEGSIGLETLLFRDLGLESLDLVVLGTTIQERYGRMPFAEFFAEIGQRPLQDVSVGELVMFIAQHQGKSESSMGSEEN
jgi:acyl carrier protein